MAPGVKTVEDVVDAAPAECANFSAAMKNRHQRRIAHPVMRPGDAPRNASTALV
jgi:hypothetical protein